tara:strand:+ start:86 stop:1300 length:1215 start_codon:yes stop_codon:yes gene_type:complete
MTRARDLSRLSNPTNFTVDSTNNRLGLNSTSPDAKLDVIGIVSATAFYGDGSNLEGVASAGLGTALSDDEAGLDVIYYTNKILGIGETITVTVPSSADIAYTQYQEISVTDDADLIISPGDELVPDILGIGTNVQQPGVLSGNGGRVRAGSITDRPGTGAPQLTFGAEVPVGYGITGAGGINVTGVVTAGSFSGSATGLTGSPDITVRNITGVGMTLSGTLNYEDVTNVDSVGLVTARSGLRVTAGGVNVTAGGVHVVGGGVTVAGIATFHNGADFNAILLENVNIVANKLSAAPNLNLDNGMVHYFTTNETTTANPNVFSSVGINTEMAIGETISVQVLSKPNNAGYFPRFSIDDKLTGITTYWNGGSAPSSAQSSGVDLNSYQIIKTANDTFDVLANTSNFA